MTATASSSNGGKSDSVFGVKMPQINVDALLNSYKKNLEILGLINKMSMEVCSGITKLQSALVKQMMSDFGNIITSGVKPSEAMARFSELARDCTVRALNDGRQIADLISANNNELTAAIAKRFKESVEETKQTVKTKTA